MKQIFIIGCQRCGTSNLYGYLDQHPNIHLAKPIRPEPKYFLQKDFYKIKIPNSKAAIGIKSYMERIFDRDSFKSSLSNSEKEKFLI